MYEEEIKKLEKLSDEYKDKIDGEINMDLHGNISEVKRGK